MLEKFYPTFTFKKVEDIPYEFLKKERVKAIMFDMDNTLVDNKYIYNKEVKAWLKDIKRKDIKICILSNSPRKKKVKTIAKDLGMNYIHCASKPNLKGFVRATEILQEKKENTMIIGDQIFTDIYGGNKYGIKTVLVEPINKNEFIGSRIKRPFEKIILKYYKKGLNK